MKKIAVNKAVIRLEQAQSALTNIEHSKEFSELDNAWTIFLVSFVDVFNALYAGSRGNNESHHWFQSKIHERRKDPLLRYIKQAKHSNSHGIEPITEHKTGGFTIGSPGQSLNLRNIIIMSNDTFSFEVLPDSDLPDISIGRPHTILKDVIDEKHGDTYPVPKEHLGKPLENQSPHHVANLALEYLKDMISEAKDHIH